MSPGLRVSLVAALLGVSGACEGRLGQADRPTSEVAPDDAHVDPIALDAGPRSSEPPQPSEEPPPAEEPPPPAEEPPPPAEEPPPPAEEPPPADEPPAPAPAPAPGLVWGVTVDSVADLPAVVESLDGLAV